MILYINCCARDNSRTDYLARALLERLCEEYEELQLYCEDLKPLTSASLQRRSALLEAGDFSSPDFQYARQFANADEIVIAAPYWDLSFPSQLKVYLENVYVTGIVSTYTPTGEPKGLCKARKLYYVVTAGGSYLPEYSFGYMKTLATQFFGIQEAVLIKAEMLDVEGFCAQKIMNEAIERINRDFVPRL